MLRLGAIPEKQKTNFGCEMHAPRVPACSLPSHKRTASSLHSPKASRITQKRCRTKETPLGYVIQAPRCPLRDVKSLCHGVCTARRSFALHRNVAARKKVPWLSTTRVPWPTACCNVPLPKNSTPHRVCKARRPSAWPKKVAAPKKRP